MIQLRSDCLVFQTSEGELFPCSAEVVTVELMGAAVNQLDPVVVREAIAAVLHFFREEQGQTCVSAGDFAQALERVLNSLGVVVQAAAEAIEPVRVADADLRRLACEADKGFELFFFPKLREEVQRQLQAAPSVLRLSGLRGCVKQLVGAMRWSGRCQQLNDQIVDYVRRCWGISEGASSCSLIVC